MAKRVGAGGAPVKDSAGAGKVRLTLVSNDAGAHAAVRDAVRLQGPAFERLLLDTFLGLGTAGAQPELSRREGQVLDCLVGHRNDGEIAVQLGTPISTAHTYRMRLFKKPRRHSRGEAVQRALGLGGHLPL